MIPSVDNKKSISILNYCIVCLTIFLMIASSPAAAQEITNVEGTEIIDIPTTTEAKITIDQAAIHPSSKTETIIVEFSSPGDINGDEVYLTDFTPSNIIENQTASAETKFEDINIEEPGSYWIYYTDKNLNDRLYPITVPGYDLSTSNFPTEVSKDGKINFDISVSKKDLSHYDGEISDIEKIRVEAWEGDDSTTLYETSFSGLDTNYQVNSDASKLDTKKYNIYVTALGSEELVLQGQRAPEPLAAADVGSVSITDTEDDSGDDDNNDDNDESSSGGGQGGGGAAGGQGNEGSSADSGPPTPKNVRNTLDLVEPASEATLNEDSSSAETEAEETEDSDEPQSSTNTGNSVTAVEFDGEAQQQVSVTNYGTPPQTVEEKVIDSIAAYNSEVNPASDTTSESEENDDDSVSEADDGNDDVIEPQSSDSDSSDESSSTDGGSDIRVVSLSDVSPSEEGDDEETTATVTFSIDKTEITNPEQLTVYKEEYVFEAQEEQWIELETSVTESSDERVEVTAETSEFSLFAVTETMTDQSQTNNSSNDNETNSQNNSTETADQTPGFGILTVLLTITAVMIVVASRD
jgi:hypothetical protein